ncbi:MAG: hypothetical protein KA354_13630 [Phycisphaerae bacterium]|nr:hypothetical protein [Phycisphaerae bacterium]
MQETHDHRGDAHSVTRRRFILGACGAACGCSLAGCASAGLAGSGWLVSASGFKERRIKPCGPGSKYVPKLAVAFVRRKEDYGIRWPGAIYDGQAALLHYRGQIESTARQLGMAATLRPEPIYSPAEADGWLAQSKAAEADGLLVVLLDRQAHAWPTAVKAADTGLLTVVFAPIGAAFTINTAPLARRQGCHICSGDDFAEVAYAMKMVRAAAKLREMRYIVLAGSKRRDEAMKHFGTKLRYLPAGEFLDEYNRTLETDEVRGIAEDYLGHATKLAGPTRQDVLNGVRSYVVARTILEREEGDAITMDCLGALGKSKVSLPCIAWSRMNDHGIPAACEADLGACLTHALVQQLFDRPGFQQDPVPDTGRQLLIGAHCSCPTRMKGFDEPAEPFYLSFHHGKRDAVPRTTWRPGERVTVVDIEPSVAGTGPRMIIGSGEVVDNIAVPPAGGCVVSVSVKLDGSPDLLDYPGFHQLFFYGDYKKQLQGFCNLARVAPVVA